jgi:pyruvate ferredoxin oxidoreductase delta subunit
MSKLPTWKELAAGAVIPKAGSSIEKKTAGWRTNRPIWSNEKCIQCLRCWIFCPDSSILVKDGKVVGIDYDHCKGCGICAEECPKKVQAITMKPESEFAGPQKD